MAQVFIPQSQDLLGTVAKIAQIKQGQQRLDLMGQQAQQSAEQLELQKKGDEIESAVKALSIPNQPDSFYATPIKTLQKYGVAGSGLVPGEQMKQFQKSISTLYQRTLKEPGFENTPEFKAALAELKTMTGGIAEKEAEIKDLTGRITADRQTQSEAFMSLLQGSGGVAPGAEMDLLSAFSRAGGTAQVRAAATAAEDRQLGVAKAKADIGALRKRDVLIGGIFLYWGEGSKTKGSLVVTNTDPSVLKFFIKWLELADIGVGRLKVNLHLYNDMNIAKEVDFWSKTLSVPKKQFRRPYIKGTEGRSISYKSGFGHGTCSVILEKKEMADYMLSCLKYIRELY